MRNLILLRGLPGIGKSSFLKENNLDEYTISPDKIRVMFNSPVHTVDNNLIISPKMDRVVWNFLINNILETRMKNGEFTIIDATHSKSSLINKYKDLAKKYRYRVYVIEFPNDLEKALAQNKKRLKSKDKYKYVPEKAIRRIHERLKSDKISGWVTKLTVSEFIMKFQITEMLFDFNKWEKVVVFGDIHSCYSPIKKYFENNQFNENNFYIFTGDYFDRGIEVVETYNFISSLINKNNVLLLEGNHERWIRNYIYGDEIKSREAIKTFKILEENGIEKKDLKKIYNKLGQVAYFIYNKNKFVITHGGISGTPDWFWTTKEFINGVGDYGNSKEVDENFSKTYNNVYSIHGHRNVLKEKIHNTNNTYNLEGQVEFGGNFRIVEIDKNGIKPIEIKNDVFNSSLKQHQFSILKKTITVNKNDSDIIKYLKENSQIIKKQLFDNVYSFNFSRKIFRNKNWNDVNVKARGLFIDLDTNKIIARSYDKFFNWEEMFVSSTDYLRNNLKFPVSAYKKYNGFLGILSVHKGEWFVASKSTVYMNFANWFKEIVQDKLTDKLKKYIVKNNVSFIFEVIDMKNDPHIIENEIDKEVVLLDVIANEFKEKTLNYEELQKVSNDFNFKVKEKMFEFNNFEDLYVFKKNKEKENVLIKDIEGFVFVDKENYRVKLKTNHYKFWKYMRSLKDKIVKNGGGAQKVLNELKTEEEYKVYNKMIEFDVNELEKMSIIDVKNNLNV